MNVCTHTISQVALTSAPHHHHHHEAEVASSPEEDGSCRQPNYQYEYKGQGEGKGISCNFSVTWRGGGGEPVSIVVTALVPEQREGAWASLSLSRNDEEVGNFPESVYCDRGTVLYLLVCVPILFPVLHRLCLCARRPPHLLQTVPSLKRVRPGTVAVRVLTSPTMPVCWSAGTYIVFLIRTASTSNSAFSLTSFAPPRTESWQALLSAPVSLQLRSGNYTG